MVCFAGVFADGISGKWLNVFLGGGVLCRGVCGWNTRETAERVLGAVMFMKNNSEREQDLHLS